MKASELRIGNWFKDRGGKTLRLDFWDSPTKLAMGQTINGCVVHPYTEEVDCAQPVPLTEEWLLKFGFETHTYRANNIAYYFKFYSETGFNRRPQFTLNDKFELVWGSSKKLLKIEYVHQLQNLFYCLTGEELTIK